MRPIKFRVWDGKYMDYDVWVNSCGAFGEPEKKYNTPNIEISSYPNKSIIMQFTGLHDKNGKEIYEGDIILQKTNNGKKPYEVKFEFGCFYAGFHNGSSTKVSPKLIQKNAEVIGNIYENPELLEK